MKKEDKEEEKRINDELSKSDDVKNKNENKKKKIVKGKSKKDKSVTFDDNERKDEDELKEGETFKIIVKEENTKDIMIKDLVNDFHLENKRQPSLDELNEITTKVNNHLDSIVN